MRGSLTPRRCAYAPCNRWINFDRCWAGLGGFWCGYACVKAWELEQATLTPRV